MVYSALRINLHRCRIYLVGLLAGLTLILGGCGSWSGPPADVVEQALNLRLQQTQQVIRGVDDSPFSSSGIKINHTESVTIDGSPAYRVDGRFTLQGRYRDRRYRQQTPFELYLTSSGDTWELLQPEAANSDGPIRWEHILLAPKP